MIHNITNRILENLCQTALNDKIKNPYLSGALGPLVETVLQIILNPPQTPEKKQQAEQQFNQVFKTVVAGSKPALYK